MLSNEKILTLIYDKTFYANHANSKGFGTSSPTHMRKMVDEIPEEMQHLMEDDDN